MVEACPSKQTSLSVTAICPAVTLSLFYMFSSTVCITMKTKGEGTPALELLGDHCSTR